MKQVPLGIAMFVLAGMNADFAWNLGAVGLPFAWASISLVLTGSAYVAGRPRWLGKRDDGTQTPALVLLNIPFVVVAYVAMLLRHFGREPCWNEVASGVFLGRRALARELPPDVDLVIDFTAEFPEPVLVRAGRTYRVLPTLDGCASEPSAFRELLRDTAHWPGRMYVHCAVGHGRSAAFAAGLLVRRGLARNVAEAEAALKRARPLVGLKPAQRRVLTGVLEQLAAEDARQASL